MRRDGIVLGLIGIIIGAGGIGIGYLNWRDITAINTDLTSGSAKQRIWYSNYADIYFPPQVDYVVIPNISIVVDIVVDVSLHLLYVGVVRCDADPLFFADLLFSFMIDNVRLLSPETHVGLYYGGPDWEFSSITLQHFIPKMASGMHNITVVVWSQEGGVFVRQNTFSIVSYPV